VILGDNGNGLIFEIWWNFFYDLFSIKNVADVNSIAFVSKRNMEECSVLQKISLSFSIQPIGHVITGDLNIIQHESLRKVISHGPKFRESQHINWKHNFKIIMDAVEDYARRFMPNSLIRHSK
jgi:hypothetical protein